MKFGQATITYLGKEVGKGQVRPVEAKVAAITEFQEDTIIAFAGIFLLLHALSLVY